MLARSNQLQILESSQPIIDEPKLLVNDIKWTALQIEYLHSQGIRIADKEWFISSWFSKFHGRERHLLRVSSSGARVPYDVYQLSRNKSPMSLLIDGTMILFVLLLMTKIM